MFLTDWVTPSGSRCIETQWGLPACKGRNSSWLN